MAFNGSGIWSALKTLVAGQTITAAEHNAEWANIKGALELARLRDGQNSPSANLPMSTYRHTGANDATARTNYATAADVQDSQLTYIADGGAADAYTLTLAPAITAYAAGQMFTFKATNANTGASTLNVSALGVKNILKNNDVALASGDIEAAQIVTVVYDGTSFQMTSHTGNATSDATLNSISALGTAADKMLYTTGVDTWAESAITSAGRALLDDAAASNQRTTLGLAIGSNVQAFSEILKDLAADLTLAQGDIIYPSSSSALANLAAGTSGKFLKTQGSGADPIWASTIFSESYTSSGQTITAGGALTLAHGLSASPSLIQVRLKCTDAGGDLGYSQNDEVIIGAGDMNAAARGVVVVVDSTNVNIRFGSDANTFVLLNKGSGAGPSGITNTKWQLIVKAWA